MNVEIFKNNFEVFKDAFFIGHLWRLIQMFSMLMYYCKKGVSKSCYVKKMFLKFRKIHRKTPVPESLF